MSSVPSELSFISDQEADKLVFALAIGQETFTENDAVKVIDWAIQTRIASGALDAALHGNVSIEIKNGEVCFKLIKPL